MHFRLLPWEYGARNLLRRPMRSALTLFALTIVVLLVLVVVGFIRGLEQSLAVSGDPHVILIHSLGSRENLENSSVANRLAALLAASIADIERRFGQPYVSPEIFLGTMVAVAGTEPSLGLVRGVTPRSLLVRRSVQILEGRWPEMGEVLVGRLAGAKLGRAEGDLSLGDSLTFEGRTWTISGRFAAAGSTLESELWCPLEDLQQAMLRQDLSIVALRLKPDGDPAEVQLFCKERLDLEIEATAEVDYYASLQSHYRPVRMLAWLVVGLVASSGLLAGLNTMYGAVVGRVRELAALQAIGFLRCAIVLSLIQEATLLAATATLLASVLAVSAVNGLAVRFTMGAFALRIDSVALLLGCGAGLLLGVLGAIPPALRAMRYSVVDGLKVV